VRLHEIAEDPLVGNGLDECRAVELGVLAFDGYAPTDYIETRKLVRLISDQLRPIYWKEGKYGYVISDHAKILRKWELGTGYVVPVKQLDLPSS
jgi:hypothetical protein